MMVRPVVRPAQPTFMTAIRTQPVPQMVAAPAQIVQPASQVLLFIFIRIVS